MIMTERRRKKMSLFRIKTTDGKEKNYSIKITDLGYPPRSVTWHNIDYAQLVKYAEKKFNIKIERMILR